MAIADFLNFRLNEVEYFCFNGGEDCFVLLHCKVNDDTDLFLFAL